MQRHSECDFQKVDNGVSKDFGDYVHLKLTSSCNKFEGSILEEIGQLKALHMLNLSHNDFSSHIPSSFENFKNLESLNLSHNS